MSTKTKKVSVAQALPEKKKKVPLIAHIWAFWMNINYRLYDTAMLACPTGCCFVGEIHRYQHRLFKRKLKVIVFGYETPVKIKRKKATKKTPTAKVVKNTKNVKKK